MANDPTVKAGSWGARTVEKIVRLTEYALEHETPVFWLVDSAGARLTDQVELFPGRRGAGRIFYNQNRLSGRVPQICCLFGPSAAGRRVHPRVLRRRLHGRGQRVDVPRLAAHGRDGGRGAHDAGGDGRCPHARDRLRERRQPRGRRRRRDRPGADVLRVHARQLAVAASALRRGSPGERVDGRRRPGERAHRVRHARADRRSRRRPQLLRDQAAVRTGGDRRLRAVRRAARRGRREQLGAQGRRAVRRLGRQGGPLHLVLRRLRHPAGVPRRRPRFHGRAPRSSARASSATGQR